jgi:PAS domain S-box-containing protein
MPGWLRWLIALGIALLALLLPTQLLPSSDAPQTLAVVTALASIGAALAIVRMFGRRWWHTPTPADASDTLSAAVAGQPALSELLTQLSASEASFRSLFEVNPAPKVLVRVSDHTIYDGNPAFERITGYKRSEMHGKTLTQLGLWPNAAVRRATWSAVNAALKDAPGQRLLEYDMPGGTRDGSIREMVISVVPVTMSGEPCLLAVMIDQTERLERARAGRERGALSSYCPDGS